MRHTQAGFTLAELTIVTVLVGLFVSGVLAGRSVILQARIKLAVVEFNGIHAAHLQYLDRYAALPGDDPRATARWPARSKDGTGDGRLSGAYGDSPPSGDPMATLTVNSTEGETLNYWWHLRLAELIATPPANVPIVAQPLNPFAGIIGVQQDAIGFPALALCQANLPAVVAIGVEGQLDEMSPERGTVRGRRQTAPNEALASTVAITAYTEADDTQYVLCRRLE
jgi:prepilin-type N-terminal cleavage/methylation domain-containing protein